MITPYSFFRTVAMCASLIFLIPFQGQTQLSGTYVIDSDGNGDYASFSAAASDLNSSGVSGSVTFDVKNGTYPEQFTLDSIEGVSSNNQVTFRSQAGDPDSVEVQYAASSSSDNYVVQLDSADHVAFKNITFKNNGDANGQYTRVFVFRNTSNIEIRNNRIIGRNETNGNQLLYGKGAQYDSIKIVDNRLEKGDWAIFFKGTVYPFTSSGILVKGNRIIDARGGVYLNRVRDVKIMNDSITGFSKGGIEFYKLQGHMEVRKNTLTSSESGGGMEFEQCKPNANDRFVVANNFIKTELKGNNVDGLRVSSSDSITIAHNSVWISGENVNGPAFYLSNSSEEKVVNNIFATQGIDGGSNEARAFDVSGYSGLQFDHNAYYAPGNYLGEWANTKVENLDSLQKLQGSENANSIEEKPAFADTSTGDLHIVHKWMNAKATPISAVTEDIDGQSRNATDPDIGADEYSPAGNFPPMSGTYTIDPNGGQFTSFEEAVDSVTQVGVNGPVTFSVAAGSYSEQLTLTEIPGADANDTVVFRAQSGDSTDVTLTHAGTKNSNYTVRLKGVDHVTLKAMTLENTSTDHSRVVLGQGYAHHNKLMGLRLLGQGAGGGLNDKVVFYANNAKLDSLLIRNSLFDKGSGGLRINGAGTAQQDHIRGMRIIGNSFEAGYSFGISIQNHLGFKIADNHLAGFLQKGIEIVDSKNPFVVEKNRIRSKEANNWGIGLDGCSGSFQVNGRIQNNFIQLGENGSSPIGIKLTASDFQKVRYNSLRIENAYENSVGIMVENGGNNKVRNNNIAMTRSGWPLESNANNNISNSDYNNLYSNGIFVAKWNGTKLRTLEALQVISGQDANSVSVHPGYLSRTDLHTNSSWLDGKGTPIGAVSDDIDGETRDSQSPDIGADEFTSTRTPMSGIYVIGSSGSADYDSLSTATEDLIARGIDSTVIFEVESGLYFEQIRIPEISGTDGAKDSITFRSLSGNPGDVTMAYDPPEADSNFVVHLNGADRVKWRNMTLQNESLNNLGRVFRMTGGAEQIHIDSNIITNQTTDGSNSSDDLITTGSGPFTDSLRITNNTFEEGATAIRLDNNSALYAPGLVIRNNIMKSNYQGVVVKHYKAPVVADNSVMDCSGKGIFFKQDSGAVKCLRNTVFTVGGGDNGLRFQDVYPSSGNEGLIVNNRVHQEQPPSYLNGTVTLENAEHLRVYHNNFNVSSQNNDIEVLRLNGATNIDLKNNILSIGGTAGYTGPGKGKAIRVGSNSSLSGSDHNIFFASGNQFGTWKGKKVGDLNAWQDSSGMDGNSLVAFPRFASHDSLITRSPWANDSGTGLAGVDIDFEGDARDPNQPDIGADEYSSNITPLSGAYSIGDTGDYAGFEGAVQDLLFRGVSASVRFEAMKGSYEANERIRPVAGVSRADSVTFTSRTGNPKDVILRDSSSSRNFMFWVNGARHLTFKEMTFKPHGNETRNIKISGRSGDLQFTGNRFLGEENAPQDDAHAHILIKLSATDSVLVNENFFQDNWHGVFYDNSSRKAKGIMVRNNTLFDVSKPIALNGTKNARIIGNRVDSANRDGISVRNSTGGFEVRRNRVAECADGINIEYSDASITDTALVANNFVHANESGSNGILINNMTYVKVYHNSVNLGGNAEEFDYAFSETNSSNVYVLNNIFVYSGDGNAAVISAGSPNVAQMDHNSYYTDSTHLARWGTSSNITSLSELQNANGMDANSMVIDPGYLSNTDLHISNDSLQGEAAPLEGIAMDIDGQQRDPNTPDIGADEFVCDTPVFKITADTSCSGGSTKIVDNSTDIPGGTTYYWDFNGDGTYDDTNSVVNDTYFWDYDTAGTYTGKVKIEQAAGCEDSTTFSVLVTEAPTLSFDLQNTGCSGADGQATVTPSGGVPPYTYLWSTGSKDSSIVGLSPGNYSISVTDARGCTVTDTVKIQQGDSLITSISATDASCQGASDGSVDLQVSGGTTPYSYQWNTGAKTQDLDSVPAGTYGVKVIDSLGCRDTLSAKVGEPDTLKIEVSVTEATCGDADGSATVDAVQNGVPPYSYQWSSGDTTATASDLSAGIYQVKVTDDRGCSNFRPVMVPNAQGPSLVVDTIEAVSCHGGSDGAIDISVSGGTEPYSYNWSNGQITQDISGLSAGPYEIEIEDSNGCKAMKSLMVPEPDPIALTDSAEPATCDSSDGVAAVKVSGGTGPYDYTWSNGGTTRVQTGLNAGNYGVTVTDENGCKAALSVNVNEEGGPTVMLDSVVRESCGATNGGIYTSVSGGNPPYDLQWSNGVSGTEDLTNVAKGTYTLTVTGDNGCEASLTEEVPAARPLSAPQCLIIGVDLKTNSNLIAWEKDTSNKKLSHYNIYKETTQAGVYNLLDRVHADSLSTYTDTLSDPQVRSWRYKISKVDTCGNESPLSQPHKTIHLTASIAVGGTDANLVWDEYQGFSYKTFYINRYTVSSGWETIDSLPTNLTSYTDVGAPLQDSSLAYNIEVKHPTGGCTAIKGEDYNSSRSNRGTIFNTPTKVPASGGQELGVKLYPNPSDGRLKLDLAGTGKQDPHIRILDMTGRALIDRTYPINGPSTLRFDLGNEAGGVYHLQVITEKGTINKKVILR